MLASKARKVSTFALEIVIGEKLGRFSTRANNGTRDDSKGIAMSEKCGARTKSGNDCRAAAVIASPFCAIHGDPERAAELGRMGGLKNRTFRGYRADPHYATGDAGRC
jgi:hypothetical protein